MYAAEKDIKLISKRILQIRLEKKLTQKQLSEMLCCTRENISRIETGLSLITLDKLLKLCDLLNVPITNFID